MLGSAHGLTERHPGRARQCPYVRRRLMGPADSACTSNLDINYYRMTSAKFQCVCLCSWRHDKPWQSLPRRDFDASSARIPFTSRRPPSLALSAASHPAAAAEPAPGTGSTPASAAAPINSTPPQASEATANAEAARRGLASMAQLAGAWAQVSSRLTPNTPLQPAEAVLAAAAVPLHPSPSPPPVMATATVGAPVEAATGAGTVAGAGRTGAWSGLPVSASAPESKDQPQPPSRSAGQGDTGPGIQSHGSGPAQAAAMSRPGWGRTRATGAPPSQGQHPLQQQLYDQGALPPQPPRQQQEQHQEQGQQRDSSQLQDEKQQQQQQHFEAIIIALKLALASLQPAPPRRDGRSPATRAVQLASTLADLCAAGLPLDAFAMCAGVVAEAAELGALRHDVIRAQLGPGVAALVHDILRVRQAPRRIELLDDEGASAIREWCLAFHDVRACVVEVVSCWDELQHMGSLPLFEQQALALEALQIGAPLGHALGLGPLSAMMEDMCLKVLFPESYASTSAWLRGLMDPAEDALFAAQQRLLAALDAHPAFNRLAGGLVVKARTKSLFSVMKKLLHLGDLSRGGRTREELYDLLGMRAIVKPPDYLPPDEAEAAATKACYIVQDVACTLWRPVPTRSKDYIVAPKPNGYQSIHLTLQLGQLDMAYDAYGTPPPTAASNSSTSSSSSSYDGGAVAELVFGARPSPSSPQAGLDTPEALQVVDSAATAAEAAPSAARLAAGVSSTASLEGDVVWTAEVAMGSGPLCLELQIRTASMDRAAETGDAAHAVYKGGLDAHTARQLQAWTQELRTRLAAQPRGRLLLRAASTSKLSPEEVQAAAERRRRRRERRAAAAAAAAATAAAVAAAAAAVAGAPPAAVDSTAPATATAAAAGCSPTTAFDLRAHASTAAAEAAVAAPGPGLVGGIVVESAAHPFSSPHAPSSTRSSFTATVLTPSAAAAVEGGGGGDPAASAAASAARHKAVASLGTGRPRPRTAPSVKAPPSSPPASSAAAAAEAATTLVAGRGAAALKLMPPPRRGSAAVQGAAPGSHTSTAAADSPGSPSGRLEAAATPAPAPAHPAGTSLTVSSSTAPLIASSTPRLRGSGSPTGPSAESGRAAGRHEGSSPGTVAPAEWITGGQVPPLSLMGAQQQQRQPQQGDALLQQQQQLLMFNSIGSLDESEEAMVIGLEHRDAAAAAEQLFRHLDVNGDGRLSLGEVRQVLLDLAAPATDRDASALMAALDRNGDGGVSLQEFVESVSLAQLQQERDRQQEQAQEREARRQEAARRVLEDEARRQQGQQQQGRSWQPWQQRM